MHKLILSSILFCFSVSASAMGLGINLGFTDGDFEDENSSNSEFDSDSRQIGFVLNTGGPSGTFNYRFSISVVDGKQKTNSNVNTEYDGFIINNIFGFKLANSEAARIWMGPALSYQSIEYDNNPSNDDEASGFGLGLAVGADFHVSPTVDLSVDGGFRQVELVKEGGFFGDEDFEGEEIYLRFNILFQTGS